MEPAAHTTTSRGPAASLTAPMTSDWAGGWQPAAYARSTVSCHAAARPRASAW